MQSVPPQLNDSVHIPQVTRSAVAYNADLLDCSGQRLLKEGGVKSFCKNPGWFDPKFVLCSFWLFWLAGTPSFSLADKGTMEGILSAKGETWIEVLDDGDFLHRFIPQWIGEGPANGGSFDQAMIQLIAELVVGNRVQIVWAHDGHLRVLRAKILQPKYPEGTFVGYLLKSSNRWIDVQNPDEGKPWRFYLPWLGGYPSEGGGYNKQILRELSNRKPTDPVRFSWKYKSRPTIESVYENVIDPIIPFWVGKKLPEPRTIRVDRSVQESEMPDPQPPGQVSPFDMLVPSADNPFEQIHANPFEKLNEKAPAQNPFDSLEPAKTETMDAVVNPFENLPLPQKGPFDLIGQE